MKVFLDKSRFALSATALLTFNSSNNPILGVEGAYAYEVGVTCHPQDSETCYGTKEYWSASPFILCDDPLDEETCQTTYLGGWGWEFAFVKGLEEGFDDPDVIEKAKTRFKITVTIEDDKTTCNVNIMDTDCNYCSAEGCEPGNVKYDCTNIKNGISTSSPVVCEPVDEPFLYPFDQYFGDLTKEKEALSSGSRSDLTKEKETLSSGSRSDVRIRNSLAVVLLGFAATHFTDVL